MLRPLLRRTGRARQRPPRPVGLDAAGRRRRIAAAQAGRASAWPSWATRRRRPHEERLPELDVAPSLRPAREGPARGAAAERVGVHGDVARRVCHAVGRVAAPASDVPDVLAPDLRCVFCGINPGRVSAAAAAHFANPRNDFWRLLHDGGFTPRLYDPQEQFALLELGYGVTNAAYRTTPGSGDLRRGDFDAARLERLARELRPRAIAFVGKEAYRGAFGERPELGPQLRDARRHGALRAPVDLARERGCAVCRATALVPRAARVARAGRARGGPRARRRRETSASCSCTGSRRPARSGGSRRAAASRRARATSAALRRELARGDGPAARRARPGRVDARRARR